MDIETARRIGQEAGREAMAPRRQDPRHILDDYDVEGMGFDIRVKLQIPTRDRVEMRHHLHLIVRAATSLLAHGENWKGTERAYLLLARATLRDANKSINNVKKVTARKHRTTSMG